jgi:hypothetical protein
MGWAFWVWVVASLIAAIIFLFSTFVSAGATFFIIKMVATSKFDRKEFKELARASFFGAILAIKFYFILRSLHIIELAPLLRILLP